MNSLKKLFSDTMIYGVSSIVGRFLNYLLVPLYTYKIAATSGGYGIVTEIYAYTALMLVILTFGMETTFFYFANKYRERSDTVFSTALSAVGSVSALFLLLLFCFIKPIAHGLGYDAHPEFLTMMGCVVAIDAFQAILFALLRFQGRAIKFAFLKLLNIFCNIGLNLFVFLVAPGLYESHPQLMGWYNPDYQVGYIFVVNLICTAGITLGFLPELRKLRSGVDWKVLKEMLHYTWPLLLFGIAGILNQVADKICFNHLVPGQEGKVQLGIYGSCVKIAMIMALITQAFRYAYEPFVFGGGKDRDSKETQALVMKYFVIFALLAFLAVMAYLDIFKYFIAPSYWEGLRVVPIVMMAEIFMSIYFNLSFWYKLIEQTWWGAVFSAIGCVVLLAINIIFVPQYGYMACAWGGFAGYGVCMLLSYFVGQKKSPVPYKVLPILGYFALALGLYGLSVWLRPETLVWQLLLNTLLLLVYVAVVCYCERDLIGSALKRLRHRK
ncbi:MAG: lipopolysaccharide biosynthesis protein [Bacteroidales bacterium]|nr:lipopolysaccharide biosynthesis protein [Bacteroidales bacterium]